MSDDEYTTESARAAADRDDLSGWVAGFLCSPGSDNPDLADQLRQAPLQWIGPVEVPIDQLHRLAGPPGAPVMEEVDEDEWRDDVDDLAEQVESGHEPAPVVVTYSAEHDHLVLEDGNHRVEAMRRAGIEQAWSVIGFPTVEDRDRWLSAR